ncbi:hypothetical protein HDU98_007920 [Podochytrium sp. JEL0797]|nr:hypothetical protein HDU98_007920 [Podochytrium sp. JEL0797]
MPISLKVTTGVPILKPPLPPLIQQPVLTAAQDEAIQALTARVPALILSVVPLPTPKEQQTLTAWSENDPSLARRYLIDKKWDLEGAAEKLRETLCWRNEFKPESILPEHVSAEAQTGKGFISGFDATGRPLLFIVPRKDVAKDADAALRFLVFSIEKCISLMPRGIEKMTVVADYHGVGLFNSTPMAVALKYLHVLQNHFPERLGILIVLNPTVFLNGLFSVLKPVMDPVTAAKIRLIHVEKKIEDNVALHEIVAADQLPIEFGGNFAFEYRHEEYWACLGQI